MNTLQIQQQKAVALHRLHQSGEMLILPNVWNPLSAALVEKSGYPIVATSSSAVALSNGFMDGENMPLEEVLTTIERIVQHTTVPVTVDFEKGYATTLNELRENIRILIQTGAVGLNFEDTNKETGKLQDIEVQCRKIQVIREVAEKMNVSLFINARTDAYISGDNFSPEEQLAETIRRGKAYFEAGANCIFPILMRDKAAIQKTVAALPCPVNIMTYPGVPDFSVLKSIGVKRVSLASSFMKIALKAMKDIAEELHKGKGMDILQNNPINSAFVEELFLKS